MQESRSDLVLREALRIMQPIAHVLIGNGVNYPQFARALKAVFLRAAHDELRAGQTVVTDSALSLLSGVHRKDVRVMRASEGPPPSRNRALSLAADVAARWTKAPEYLDERGAPRILALRRRRAEEPSFETLVQSVSKDFHARSVLDELIRLGLASLSGDQVRLHAAALGSSDGFAEQLARFGANAADHLAAGVANLGTAGRGAERPHLDRTIVAERLSAPSCAALQALAQELCAAAFERVGAEARVREARDAALPAGERTLRARFGAYFYAEALTDEVASQSRVPDAADESANDEVIASVEEHLHPATSK